MSENLVNYELGVALNTETGRWEVYGKCLGECAHMEPDQAIAASLRFIAAGGDLVFASAVMRVAAEADALNRPRN